MNGKRYIGQSSQKDQQRLWEHKTHLKKGTHQNIHLQRAWNKYTESNFVIKVLKTCETIDELNKLEEKYVSMYNTMDREYGYNIRGPGDNKYMLKETKDRISKSKLGVSVHTPESIERIRISSKNRVHTLESRRKRSQKLKGYVWSEEIRNKWAQSHRKQTYPVLLSPDGVEYTLINATQFARDHNLLQQSVSKLVNHQLTHHKGWTLRDKQ